MTFEAVADMPISRFRESFDNASRIGAFISGAGINFTSEKLKEDWQYKLFKTKR